jgi:hypothetical protein
MAGVPRPGEKIGGIALVSRFLMVCVIRQFSVRSTGAPGVIGRPCWQSRLKPATSAIFAASVPRCCAAVARPPPRWPGRTQNWIKLGGKVSHRRSDNGWNSPLICGNAARRIIGHGSLKFQIIRECKKPDRMRRGLLESDNAALRRPDNCNPLWIDEVEFGKIEQRPNASACRDLSLSQADGMSQMCQGPTSDIPSATGDECGQ